MDGGTLEEDHHPGPTSPSRLIKRNPRSPPHPSSHTSRPTYLQTSYLPDSTLATQIATNFQAAAANGVSPDAFAGSYEREDAQRNYRGVQSSHQNGLLPSPLTSPIDSMAPTLAASRQPTSSSLRSNGNGTTPRYPAVPTGRNAVRSPLRSTTHTVEDRSAMSGPRSTPAMTNGYTGTRQSSVKDLTKKFDQSAAPPSNPPRKLVASRGPLPTDPAAALSYRKPSTAVSSQPTLSGMRSATDSKKTPARGTQRPKFAAEDQLSSNSQSFASRINRPRNAVSTNAQASKSMVQLSPQPSPAATSTTFAQPQQEMLFGEISPEQADSLTAGYGIDHSFGRRISDSDLRSSIRLHQRSRSDHDAEPASPTDWYRSGAASQTRAEAADESRDSRDPRSHSRALSDLSGSRGSTVRGSNISIQLQPEHFPEPQPKQPQQPQSPISRLPVPSVRKVYSPPDSPSPTSTTRSNSPAAVKRPPQTGRLSRQQVRAKTPASQSATPTNRAKTPTHTPGLIKKQAPTPSAATSSSNRLNAYIATPPPKLSPPLRSSRPRQPVSTATTASSRMKAVERTAGGQLGPAPRRGSKPQEDTTTKNRKISIGPVDFAQRRETIKLAYTKSIRESQAREARQQAAERRKKELEAVAQAKAEAEAAAAAVAAVAASASQSEENVAGGRDEMSRPSTRDGLDEPLRLQTHLSGLSEGQGRSKDSPTLGIPGSFPSYESPVLIQDEAPPSAVSAVSGVTEFDNEPQTGPPSHDQSSPITRQSQIITSPLPIPPRQASTYQYPFEDEVESPEVANGESIPITISLDTDELEVSNSNVPSIPRDFGSEPRVSGEYPDSPPQTFPEAQPRATVTILGPEVTNAYAPPKENNYLPQNSSLPAVAEHETPLQPEETAYDNSLGIRTDDTTQTVAPESQHESFDEPATDLDQIEKFYIGGHMQDNIAALRQSTFTSSDAGHSQPDQPAPDHTKALSVPQSLNAAKRNSQQSVWTDFSFESHESSSGDNAPTFYDQSTIRKRDLASPPRPAIFGLRDSGAAGLQESPEMSPIDDLQPSAYHQLPEVDTGGGFSIPYLSEDAHSQEPVFSAPSLPDHAPPPPPMASDYELDDNAYFDDTRPSSYLHSQDGDGSEGLRESLSTPQSTGQLSLDLQEGQKAMAEEDKEPEGTVDGQTAKEKSRLTQRHWVVRELIDTESIFIRDMSVVEEIYKGTAEACPRLDAKTVKLIFRNTDEIINFHTSLLAQLKDGVFPVYTPKGRRSPLLKESASNTEADGTTLNSMTNGVKGSVAADISEDKDRQTSIGPIFSRNVEKMKSVHEGYLRSSDLATKRLIQIQADPTVKVWLNECNEVAKDLTAAWNLDSLLIKPMQRLTKYPNLLAQLLEHTPADHPDREPLLAARIAVENAILEINKTKKNFELVGQIVGRKRKESDVKASLTRAFGKRVDKLQASSNRPAEDEEYLKLYEKFGDDYLRLQVVLRDVEYYTRTVSAYVHEFLQYLSSMELVMRLQPSPWPEIESKWVQFNVSMRDIEKVALEQHTSAVRKQVIEPFEQVIRCYNNPSTAMKKRGKRRLDYEKSVQLKKSGKKVDKQLSELVEQYEALNDTLKKELPKLSALTAKIGNICLGKFVILQTSWFLMWREKVKTVLADVSHVPEFAETVTTFQRDFKDVEEQAQTIGVLNPTLKPRTSQSTTDDGHSTRSHRPPALLTPRSRGLSTNSDQVAPSLPTPDFVRRSSGNFTLTPMATSSPVHYHRDYYSGINGHIRGASSPVTNDMSASGSRSMTASGRPSTGRSFESSGMPRQSSDSTAQTSLHNTRRDSNSTMNSATPGTANFPPGEPDRDGRRFSGLFHSAMPMTDAEKSQRSSRASSRERNAAVNGGYNVLWLAASLFEFNIETTKQEAGYPYLIYQAGEIFDVIAEKGELWLAKNQDDPNMMVGWIWSKHFAKLADF